MKNIAIVIDSLTGGGAEKVMLSLAKACIDLGNKVTLLSLSSDCDYPIPAEITWHTLFSGKISKIDRFWQLKDSVHKLEQWFDTVQREQNNFDLILSNLDKSNNLLANSVLQNDKRLFFIVHNSIEEELFRQRKLGPFSYRYLAKSKENLSDKQLITVSKGIENEILKGSRITPLSVETIYNPFDLTHICQQANIVNKDIPTIDYVIHVGRLARQKRHDVLFEAFKTVDSNCKLVLLCNKPKKAKKLARKYGIEQRIICPGFQTNPYNWIKQAKVLALSSDYEGLPTVLIEALSVGTKVVSTNCSFGPDEILTENLAQFLVPRREPQSLSEAINSALHSNVEVGDAEILEKVNAENIALQYLALCQESTN